MKRVLSLIVCFALTVCLFSGCGTEDEAYVPTGDGLTWDEDYTGPVSTQATEETEQALTLTYYTEESMNPYQSNDFSNRVLFSLMYQGLFTVDRDYNVEPMLCSGYSVSQDMKTYVFYINENATFSDGTKLTAEDVLASLQTAKASRVYGSRFSKVNNLALTEDGGITVGLNTAYENFPILLDVPILKATEQEAENPLGTGPYRMSGTGVYPELRRRSDWWCSAELPVSAPTISLVAAESINQIRDNFQFGDVDLVCADPGSDRYADYRCDFELWDCENGIFVFLVCNASSSVFSNEAVRTALTHAIDRDTLVQDYYRSFARSATLPASPQSPYYSQVLASRYGYDPTIFAKAVSDAGMEGRKVVLLVNSEDSLRLRVGRAIVEMLNEAGLAAEIMSYGGNEFYYALNNFDYDLYLGQTKLSANMDLSHFFSTSGNLNYAGLSNAEVYTLCQQALENSGNYYSLHQTIMDQGYLCPLLFRSYAVYATRGALTGLTPARDNVFYYSIGKTMDDALLAITE